MPVGLPVGMSVLSSFDTLPIAAAVAAAATAVAAAAVAGGGGGSGRLFGQQVRNRLERLLDHIWNPVAAIHQCTTTYLALSAQRQQ